MICHMHPLVKYLFHTERVRHASLYTVKGADHEEFLK